MASSEAVANEPRLFVGQVSVDCSEEDLYPLFRPFGTIRNLHILRGPDSKSRGCAMVLYSRWSEAEAAAEGLEGTTNLSNGQGRPLVVHFANPRKLPPGQPPEGGLAPKKLFVGQVPRDITEDMLRPYFEPYGDIEHINILRTQRGQSAGCGFVQFRKWSQAEAAMEAHSGKTRLGSSEVPLVVKFADAKRKDQVHHQLAMGLRGPAWMHDLKHMDPAAADYAAYQLGAQQQWANQRLLRGNPMLASNALGNQLAQMQNLMPQQGYQSHYEQQSQYPSNQRMMPQDSGAFPGGPTLDDRMQEAELASQLINHAAGLGTMSPLPKQGVQDTSDGTPSGSTNELAQQLGQLSLAVMDAQGQQQQDPNSYSSQNYMNANTRMQNPLGQSYSSSQGFHGSQGFPGNQSFPSNQGFPVHPSLMGRGGMPHYNQQLMNLARGPMSASAMGRPWGQKIGSNDKYNEWKLFVGQVPLEATEETIWELFSPIGAILELYILRNNNGKSRGCAFVTYQTKILAEKAITALNGCHMTSGKILVVKFADRSSANKTSAVVTPTQQQANLLDMYVQ